MNKYFFVALFFLFGMNSPIKAVENSSARSTITPLDVKVASAAVCLEILSMPIVFDVLDGVLGFPDCNIKQFWREYAVASVIGGALTYYILNKYTPQGIYDWALSVMQRKDKVLSSEEGSLERMQALFSYYHKLAYAINCLDSASNDMPEDPLFQLDCEQLTNELKNLKEETIGHALVAAHIWFKDLPIGCSVPKGYVNAVEWSGKLIGKLPGIDYMWW